MFLLHWAQKCDWCRIIGLNLLIFWFELTVLFTYEISYACKQSLDISGSMDMDPNASTTPSVNLAFRWRTACSIGHLPSSFLDGIPPIKHGKKKDHIAGVIPLLQVFIRIPLDSGDSNRKFNVWSAKGLQNSLDMFPLRRVANPFNVAGFFQECDGISQGKDGSSGLLHHSNER